MPIYIRVSQKHKSCTTLFDLLYVAVDRHIKAESKRKKSFQAFDLWRSLFVNTEEIRKYTKENKL